MATDETVAVADNPEALADNLDYTDLVKKDSSATPKYVVNEVFRYTDLGNDEAVGGAGDNEDMTGYVIKTSTTTTSSMTDILYQLVDTTAPAEPDNADTDSLDQQVPVMASIPAPEPYEHLHFGVWASLKPAATYKTTGAQELAGLGIGFVQSIGDGMTPTQLSGTYEFEGDWVGIVQTAHNAKLFKDAAGTATLTADFDKGEFEGELMGLATLEGDLSGNGFSGTKVTDIEHDDLDKTAAFKGMFEGGIYGPEGEEAGGIFDFSSKTGGAFRGAMGGARDTD